MKPGNESREDQFVTDKSIVLIIYALLLPNEISLSTILTKRKNTFWDSKELQELDMDDVQVLQLDASSVKTEIVSIYEVGMRTVNAYWSAQNLNEED